ncbi:amino acid adenylation domain-containing protein [Clostridium tagluense]|uniref:non-ribosomal peptide synthetase n=1 Tax=Clostridium tagluense TaxID=360422 RepID=UPI001CF4441D|nr:non-ribosomal peptide synthetase [Clostridium tagluense]MCB2311580.1 amino acid adenylation domain-containing protein [Clostridium tagluense]MCB2316304.1 amino acid adenylation domain-containing protein [Clostridium tagluense]MCB2321159.1 amino acid adenylation domain-containing protein [Clostridium tagluense]MCB2326173.1 amino acid adenylation domain-containing protein [Clostridium tagluense]MCB2330896.1 amino acid adenylation domain-containing protein [Clostridium tagluense]
MKSYSKEELVIAANAHIEEQQYWFNNLSDNLSNTILMTKDTMLGTEYVNGIYEFQLSNDDFKRTVKFCRDNDYTIHMIFVVTFTLMIYKYTGLTDILIDTPIYKQEEEGPFINTVLTLRNRLKEEGNLNELLLSVRKNISEAVKYQNFPICFLVDKLSSDTLKINYPLTDVAIIYENIQNANYMYENHYSFILSLVRESYSLSGKIHYNSSAYASNEIETMGAHFCKVLHELLVDLDIAIKDVNMMGESEKRQILYEYNDTKAVYPDFKTLHGLFMEQVKKKPDAIAAVFCEESITYGELDRKSEVLAYELQQKGVTRDSIVGIIVKRSLKMIIGILGILKAGGAYLPIDPDTPAERLNYIIEDSGMKLAVTQTRYYDCCHMVSEVIDLEDDTIYGKKVKPIEMINQPRDLAYVIYTSGSTGNPKGVMIEHTSVINRINWMQKKYALTKDDVIIQKTPFTFDVSVWEMFWWMFVGAKVCFLIPDGEKNPAEIIKSIEENKVTVMHFVPSMLSIFLEYVKVNEEEKRITSLEKVFSSGETLTVDNVKKFNKVLNKKNHTKLYNLYGPTEATVDVTYFDCPQDVEISTIPIGKPIDNIRIYILDSEGRLQPQGIPGEICIAGVGVGRGYLNKPELTNDKFTEDPFVPEERMFKTGDSGRWMEDGNIEYLGRNDFQVKIRGFRIELGEIEKQLLNCELVKEAVVLVKTDKTGEKYICAYVIGSENIVGSELKVKLSKALPDYMIPAFFIQLDKIPLTSNGKVNRKKLLVIEEKNQEEMEYVAPETELEKQLEVVWCEVLGVDQVGANVNFFDIGGQSLKVVNMVAKIYSRTGIKMHIEDVFKYRTIRKIADNMKNMEINQWNRIEHGERKETYPTSAAQNRLYILNTMEDNIAYNITCFMGIEGQFDIDKGNAAINQLINRHESLRTAFEFDGKNIVQRIHTGLVGKVEVYEENVKDDTNPLIYEERLNKVVRKYIKPFQLDTAPLFRMLLLRVNQKKYYLLFDIHHIIADGISVEILMKEFSDIYNGKELPEVKLQYSDYSEWQSNLLKSEEMKKQEEYWMNKFSGEIPVLNMPTDFVRPTLKSSEGDNIIFKLDKELTSDLKKLAKATGSTMYMLLLSGVNILLSKYSGQEDIIVGSPIAGRHHSDLEKIIGMFVNTIAMRNYPVGEKNYEEFLREVKENALMAYENQDYQFEELVDKLRISRDPSRSLLFDVMFAMQNIDNKNIGINNLTFKLYNQKNMVSKFDLVFISYEVDKEIIFIIEYCTKLFIKDTMEIIIVHLKNIFKAIANDKKIKLNEILLLSENEFNVISEKVKGDLENSTHNIEFNF